MHVDRYVNRSKGVFVEAIKLTNDNADTVSNWCGGQIVEMRDAINHDEVTEGLNIKTPHGMKRLVPGMYLLQYQGEFYLAQGAQFEANYDRMTPLGQQTLTPPPPKEEPKPLTKDPFEGMTRMNEGPKP